MLKSLWLVALFSVLPTSGFAFATKDYQLAQPKGWHAVTKYGGSDVGFLKSKNNKEAQVILVATMEKSISLDKDFTYLKSEMKKMASIHKELKIARFAQISKAPKNAYVKYSFKSAGMLKNEILVAVPSKTKTHFIMLSSDGGETEGAERELVAMVHSLKLKQ